MPQKILSPNRVGTGDSVIPVSLGGTGASTASEARDNLGIVGNDMINGVEGVAGLDASGRLSPYLVSCDDKSQIMLQGHIKMFPGDTATYRITNYDSRGVYTVLSPTGVVGISGDIITFTAPSNGANTSFSVNGKNFPITLVQSYAKQPSITYPIQGAANLLLHQTFQCSAFDYFGKADVFAGTSWQLSKDPSFSTIVADTTDSLACATSWALSSLDPTTTYYLRVRQKGQTYGYSAWSNTVSFTTGVRPYVATPSIVSPSNGATNSPLSMSFASSAFTPMVESDTHFSSDWQLATDSGFTNIVAQTISDANNKTTWSVANLAAVTTFFVRVRYTGVSNGTSGWSNAVSFTTQINPYIAPPSITSPADGASGLTPVTLTMTESAFSCVAGTDSLNGSHWQLSTTSDFSTIVDQYYNGNSGNVYSWVKTGLNPLTTYYVRARQQGVKYGWSQFGAGVRFSTKAAPSIAAPTITYPAAGSTSVAKKPVLQCAGFSVLNGTDTQVCTEWEIYSDSSLTTRVLYATTTGSATNYDTSAFFTSTSLNGNTTYYARARHQGATYGYSSWGPAIQFTTIPNTSINTPSVTAPANGAGGVNLNTTLSSNAFSVSYGSDTHQSSSWQIATDVGFTNVVQQVTDSASYLTSWPVSGLSTSTVYYARVRHKGATYGYSGWSNAIAFTTMSKPTTPSITAPANGATGLNTTINFSSTSFSMGSGSDSHAASDWQLSTDSSFSNIISQTSGDTTNLTTWSVSGLAIGTSFYVRVRHKGSVSGYSDWSNGSTFRTMSKPNAPSIVSPSNGTSSVPIATTITSSAFSQSNGSESHASSTWQVATDAGFSNVVAHTENDSNNKTAFNVGGLSYNTTYYVRVAYQGSVSGYSDWSPTSSFTTKIPPPPNAPSITSPASGASLVSINPTLTSSAFTMASGSDTQSFSDWQISTTSDFTNIVRQSLNDVNNKTSWPVSGLAYNTVYYARVRYKGAISGYSDWSPTSSFTTMIPPAANAPSITSPASGASLVSINPTLTSSAFSMASGSDTQSFSDWQISTTSDFSSIVRQSLNDTTHLTSWPVTGLAYNTTYYARVRYKGAISGYTDWSGTSSFTTLIPPPANTPSITSPANGASLVSTSLTLTSSAFSMASGSDTQSFSDWQISTTSDFFNIVQQSLNDTTHLTSWPVTGLANNTTYYARVRYKGAISGYTDFSPVISFTTIPVAYIAKPSITSPANGITTMGDTGNGCYLGLTVASSAFTPVYGSDTLAAMEVSVISVPSSTASYGPYTFSGTSGKIYVPGVLTYSVKVRHKGNNLGYSEWSDAVTFTAGFVPMSGASAMTYNLPGSGGITRDNESFLAYPLPGTGGIGGSYATYVSPDASGSFIYAWHRRPGGVGFNVLSPMFSSTDTTANVTNGSATFYCVINQYKDGNLYATATSPDVKVSVGTGVDTTALVSGGINTDHEGWSWSPNAGNVSTTFHIYGNGTWKGTNSDGETGFSGTWATGTPGSLYEVWVEILSYVDQSKGSFSVSASTGYTTITPSSDITITVTNNGNNGYRPGVNVRIWIREKASAGIYDTQNITSATLQIFSGIYNGSGGFNADAGATTPAGSGGSTSGGSGGSTSGGSGGSGRPAKMPE